MLRIVWFLSLLALGFNCSAQSVRYNSLSGEYQYDSPKIEKPQGVSAQYWQWEDRSAGSFPSQENFQYQQSYQSQPSVVPQSAYVIPVSSEFLQSDTAAAATSAVSDFSGFSSENYIQSTPVTFGTPPIQWRFAKPQQELAPEVMPAKVREDEAQINNPEIIAKNTPKQEILAKSEDQAPVVAEAERDTLSWQTVE
jgi:hypothetical protein